MSGYFMKYRDLSVFWAKRKGLSLERPQSLYSVTLQKIQRRTGPSRVSRQKGSGMFLGSYSLHIQGVTNPGKPIMRPSLDWLLPVLIAEARNDGEVFVSDIPILSEFVKNGDEDSEIGCVESDGVVVTPILVFQLCLTLQYRSNEFVRQGSERQRLKVIH
jgi:hypothetical protein